MTKIVTCNCKHEFQDQEYGKQKRLHNVKTKTPTKGVCTVCKSEKLV